MKRSNTIIQNIEFLISQYKREIETQELTIEERISYENFIYELQFIIELSR